jgi:hypothetical protein
MSYIGAWVAQSYRHEHSDRHDLLAALVPCRAPSLRKSVSQFISMILVLQVSPLNESLGCFCCAFTFTPHAFSGRQHANHRASFSDLDPRDPCIEQYSVMLANAG